MVKFLIDKGFEYRHAVVTQAASSIRFSFFMIIPEKEKWYRILYKTISIHLHLEMNTYCFVQLLSTANQPKMKLRSARSFVFDLSPVLMFEILKYINPLLHYLVSRHYFHDNVFNIDYDKRLPISLLFHFIMLKSLKILKPCC